MLQNSIVLEYEKRIHRMKVENGKWYLEGIIRWDTAITVTTAVDGVAAVVGAAAIVAAAVSLLPTVSALSCGMQSRCYVRLCPSLWPIPKFPQ